MKVSAAGFEKLVAQAKVEAQQALVGVAKDSAAGSTMAAKVIADVVDRFTRDGGLSPEQIAQLRGDVAAHAATFVSTLQSKAAGLAQFAEPSTSAFLGAVALLHAADITAREGRVLDAIAGTEQKKAPALGDPLSTTVHQELAGLLAAGSKAGATLCHDIWYAQAATTTARGARADDVGANGIKVRAREFMLPSAAILASGDPTLLAAMEKNNVGGVQNTMQALADVAAGGAHAKAHTAGDYSSYVSSLPKTLDASSTTTTTKISAQTEQYLRAIGQQLRAARASYLEGKVPDWSKLPLAHDVLSATHDRFLQANSWAPPEQQKPFDQLSVKDQALDLSSATAAVYGLMRAAGLIDDVK